MSWFSQFVRPSAGNVRHSEHILDIKKLSPIRRWLSFKPLVLTIFYSGRAAVDLTREADFFSTEFPHVPILQPRKKTINFLTHCSLILYFLRYCKSMSIDFVFYSVMGVLHCWKNNAYLGISDFWVPQSLSKSAFFSGLLVEVEFSDRSDQRYLVCLPYRVKSTSTRQQGRFIRVVNSVYDHSFEPYQDQYPKL